MNDDEAASLRLAMMLQQADAEEAGYVNYGGSFSEMFASDEEYENDDTWKPQQKKKPAAAKKTPAKKKPIPRPKKTPVSADAAIATEATLEIPIPATGSTPDRSPRLHPSGAHSAESQGAGAESEFNTGKFTDDEVKLFLEGLEIHGRDWPKVNIIQRGATTLPIRGSVLGGDAYASFGGVEIPPTLTLPSFPVLAKKLVAHIKTRNANAIRSYAQKYFIRLYRDNLPLPNKVRESGGGYTLSGKELDPESAAAKPYLKARKTQDVPCQDPPPPEFGLPKEKTSDGLAPVPIEKRRSPEEAVLDNQENEAQQQKRRRSNGPSVAVAAAAAAAAAVTTAVATPTALAAAVAAPSAEPVAPVRKPDVPLPVEGPTEYQKNRPRRIGPLARAKKRTYLEDEHSLLPCHNFSGKFGSDVEDSQPFDLRVERKALVVMDLHAHLMETEVIGYLAGKFDPEKRELSVHAALPVSRDDDRTGNNPLVNVEADSVSLVATAELAHSMGFILVGWYHSHPVFNTNPSDMDVGTQLFHQSVFGNQIETQGAGEGAEKSREEDSGEGAAGAATEGTHTCRDLSRPMGQPFVGAIVGPYDPKLATAKSSINWFMVSKKQRSDADIPRKLQENLDGDEAIARDGVEEVEVDKMIRLINECGASTADRTNFGGNWRGDRRPETRREKMLKSLRAWALGSMKPAFADPDAAAPDASAEPAAAAASKEGHVPFEKVLSRIEAEIGAWVAPAVEDPMVE
ncbi:hypothetical protein BDK51DRAFT_46892 [Blyttiomyces helicus]|uniref:Myb-like domain-containing protein n=1 Tax=Blyttiomyces helicus TaxID=388810 RepID=A0A4P9WDR8_9FUNG|nr:hypothetical protein BDK51DRAFT_46892 [Blyttiomyces helicus]|eukprot:RKO89885.1 hypothetical protein BDK51DRAFT_46892 [Blyttiomyces helicus]